MRTGRTGGYADRFDSASMGKRCSSVATGNASLEDVTTGTDPFRYMAVSENTENESFTIGASGDGDSSSTSSGSLTGTLVAGHEHVFESGFAMQAAFEGLESLVAADAVGNSTLAIGSPGTEAPAPGTLWLLASGMAGLGLGLGRPRKRPTE